jgi:hypothetical protein
MQLELTKEFARPAGIMSFAGFLHWKLLFHHQKKPVSKYKKYPEQAYSI